MTNGYGVILNPEQVNCTKWTLMY